MASAATSNHKRVLPLTIPIPTFRPRGNPAGHFASMSAGKWITSTSTLLESNLGLHPPECTRSSAIVRTYRGFLQEWTRVWVKTARMKKRKRRFSTGVMKDLFWP